MGEDDMGGYFGTAQQQHLQKLSDEAVPWMRKTQGACNAGRFMSTDDPERLGWDHIFSTLDRDGVFGFRMLSSKAFPQVRARLVDRGYRMDSWDVFTGTPSSVNAARTIASIGLPEGYSERSLDGEVGPVTRQVQTLMNDCGVVPFSGAMLTGALGPSAAVVVVDEHGSPVAAAFTYLGHFSHSPFAEFAWGGLVAVSPTVRGLGLGKLVNAIMVVRAFDQLGATGIYELVSSTNVASRRMVEASGVLHAPEYTCGLATAAAERFTR
jgi:hypothetical protein